MPSKAVGVKLQITIDGRTVECEGNQTVLDVARANGIEIPTLCYNPLYGSHRSGACRMCLVEVVSGGRPGLQPSCTLPVSSNLGISTKSPNVYKARRMVVEFLLSEHTQRCRDCPESGNCTLAALCRDYDINGVPVCAECPNQGESCLLKRRVLCMGPITYANCNAYCTRKGYRCEGCHSMLVNEDVLRFGLQAYVDAGFEPEEIIQGATVYASDRAEFLRKIMKEVGML
jgi:predicted molibdopterin-dependent oxidoreductase YjgC